MQAGDGFGLETPIDLGVGDAVEEGGRGGREGREDVRGYSKTSEQRPTRAYLLAR